MFKFLSAILLPLLLSATVTCYAQQPNISYSTPQVLIKGTFVKLSPANTGGAVPATVYSEVTALAGSGSAGSADGTGAAASFNGLLNMAKDAAGNIYAADYTANVIRKITPAGVVTTLAGSGAAGAANGTGAAASFKQPSGIAVDAAGNVYVGDSGNNLIRKITPAGVVTTFAGSTAGAADGTGAAAQFKTPRGLAIDTAGNLYVADYANNLIRKITPGAVVTTFAGSSTAGSTNGTGTVAKFSGPLALSTDIAGNLYVADYTNNLIRKITPGAVVSTLAGSGAAGVSNGTGVAASFRNPFAIATDAPGNIYVADRGNNLIRKITPAGVVTTLAGTGEAGQANGPGATATFNDPRGLVVDSGVMYVGDFGGHQVRRIFLTGFVIGGALPAGLIFDGATGAISGTPTVVSPAANNIITAYNAWGSSTTTINITVIPPLAPPNISYPNPLVYGVGSAVTLNPANTGGAVPATIYSEVTALAGSGSTGSADGTGAAASFNGLLNMAKDAAGNIYAADYTANVIRKITPAGVVTTLAGSGAAGAANGTGAAASFKQPSGIAVDAAGNVYVGDSGNNLIRKITPAGVVTTFAGSTAGAADGTGAAAQFKTPRGLAIDTAGNLYVADYANNLIRKITPGAMVTTFAGSSTAGSTNGTGTAAKFSGPLALSADVAGNLYVADYTNNLIRKITPGAVVSTLAGSGAAGAANGTGAAASFKNPFAIATDITGNVYVADRGNNLIRKITPAGVVTTLAGTGAAGSGNGVGAVATLNDPRGLVVDGSILFISDFGGHQVRKISLTGYAVSPALPAGLVFNNTTGVISGKPATISPETDYTVSAYNTAGSSSIITNITVKATLPAPAISYSTPHTYPVGSPVNLIPSNTGGAVPTIIYGQVSLLAGGIFNDHRDGTGTQAGFRDLSGITTDAAGNVYATDDNLIRKITPAGVTTTFAGKEAGGAANGTGTAASFLNPLLGPTTDPAGNLYVADLNNHRIRRISPAARVVTFAGSDNGFVNGTRAASRFRQPTGVAADTFGNIYLADDGNNAVRKITGDTVTTFAGGGAYGSADGTGTAATFSYPEVICTDSAGNVYAGQQGDKRIRKITPGGVVTTLAGGGGAYAPTDGTGAAATFIEMRGIAADLAGNIWVVDNPSIRKVSPAGVVTTLETTSEFQAARALAIDGVNLYAVTYNVIQRISLTGYTISPALPPGLIFNKATGAISGTPVITGPAATYTVTAYNAAGSSITTINIGINPASAAPDISYATPQTFNTGTFVSLAPDNTGGPVPATTYTGVTTLAGSGADVSSNGTGAAAGFRGILNMATDAAGNIYAADYTGNVIRKITPAGVTTTLAGSGMAGSANGTGTAATFNHPSGVVLDEAGNVYVCDSGNSLIRKVTPAGAVTTFAGSTVGAVNGTGAAAKFHTPSGAAIDGNDNLYVADFTNNLIRKITPGGVVTTFAGSGAAGGINGSGTAASFNGPRAICIDTAGNLYVADYLNSRIRKITPAGLVTTFAGNIAGSADGTGVGASFTNPFGVAADVTGNIYVADRGNNLIRQINVLGVVTTIAGNGTAASTDGTGTAVAFNDPRGLAVAEGILYVGDFGGHQVRKVILTGYTISPALPAGLTFDGTSGVISGTPSAASTGADYTVTAYNKIGSSTATIHIAVNNMGGMALAANDEVLTEPISSDGPLVKQGLSPNGDGVNDVLIINNIEKYPDNKLTIMSAAGTTVYQASGYDNTVKVFDGHSNKTKAMQKKGTYFYRLEYKDKGVTKYKTGYILLKY